MGVFMFKYLTIILFFVPLTINAFTLKKYDIDKEQLRSRAKLYIPNNASDKLVIVLHGYADPDIFINMTLPIKSFVDKKKIFLLKPYGTRDILLSRFWNTEEWCCNFFKKEVDDIEYLRKLINQVKKDHPEIKKTYIMGHSNGAFMSQKMICEHGDLFDGMVSYAGAGLIKSKNCKELKNFRYLQINGKGDGLVYFNGLENKYPSFDEHFSKIIKKNSCEIEERVWLSLRKIGALKDIELSHFKSCQNDNEFQSWVLPKGRHLTILGKASLPAIFDFLEI